MLRQRNSFRSCLVPAAGCLERASLPRESGPPRTLALAVCLSLALLAASASAQLFDNTMVDGPMALQQWVKGYSGQFVRVSIEKLMTYALGRGLDYQDMPLVRAIARDVGQQDNRFSALVLAVVRSAPFQMNTKTE